MGFYQYARSASADGGRVTPMEQTDKIVAEIGTRIELGRLKDKALRRGDEAIATILRSAITMIDRRIARADANLKAGRERAHGTSLIARNIRVRGRRTSVRLEAEFWQMLQAMAQETHCSLHQLCDIALREKGRGSATSAIRVFVLRNLWGRTSKDRDNLDRENSAPRERSAAHPENGAIVFSTSPSYGVEGRGSARTRRLPPSSP